MSSGRSEVIVSPPTSPPVGTTELADLEAFREEWRRSLAHGNKPSNPQPQASTSSSTTTTTLKSPPKDTAQLPEEETHTLLQAHSLNGQFTQVDHNSARAERGRHSALELYNQAVDAESSGRLSNAVQLYARAFKLDPNVDKAYAHSQPDPPHHHHHHAPTSSSLSSKPASAIIHTSTDISAQQAAVDSIDFQFRTQFQLAPDYNNTSTLPLVFGPLEEPVEIEYDPFTTLPPEVIFHILPHLSVQSILSLAGTCRTLWSLIMRGEERHWRAIVDQLFGGDVARLQFGLPTEDSDSDTGLIIDHEVVQQNSDVDQEETYLVVGRDRFKSNYHQMLLHQPRVRFDGVYISVCHYVRAGVIENAWSSAVHLITYHRFLRFYPNGRVISLLTTLHPSVVVPSLDHKLRANGLHIGSWKLFPDEAGKQSRIEIQELADPDIKTDLRKYQFEMRLALTCTHRGKWNKIELKEYTSLNMTTSEELEIPLKYQKAFYFSKVRSWE